MGVIQLTQYPGQSVRTPQAVGSIVDVEFGEPLLQLLLDDLGVDEPDAAKGAAGYVVAAPVPGPRSNAAARPTRALALDYDDSPTGPDWAALEGLAYVAYTTDSHTDAQPRWRVWVELDDEYDAAAVASAECPWVGCHLRAISQPVFLPTKTSAVEWRLGQGRPLALGQEWGGRAAVAPAPFAPPAKRTVPSQASTNALVTRWLSREEGTNALAGATGACLAQWGWEDEDIRGYLEAWLSADTRLGKHINDALRGAQKRRAGDRIVGFPKLAELGVDFRAEVKANDADALWALIEAQPEPGPPDAPAAADDGWGGFEYGGAIAAWVAPEVPWVCEALCLAPGAPGLLTGFGGSGKTTLAQHLAVCVATGRPLLDTYPVRLGSVTHLDYEQGADLTRRRYQQMGVQDLPDDALARLRFKSYPRRKLTDDDALQALLLAARGQTLLIIDSLIASTELEDGENDSSARSPLDVLGQVSELTGCTVLVIHHSKKDRSNGRTSARGSGSITDGVSVHITYEKDDELGVTSPAALKLEKVRHIIPPGALVDGISVAQDGTGRLAIVEKAPSKTGALADTIVLRLADGWTGTTAELQTELQCRRKDMYDALASLRQSGILADKGLVLR